MAVFGHCLCQRVTKPVTGFMSCSQKRAKAAKLPPFVFFVTWVWVTWLVVPELAQPGLVQLALVPCLEVYTSALHKALQGDDHRALALVRKDEEAQNRDHVEEVADSLVEPHPNAGRCRKRVQMTDR